jgi:hypothetical protein
MLSQFMLNVVMPSVILLYFIRLGVVELTAIMPVVILPSGIILLG